MFSYSKFLFKGELNLLLLLLFFLINNSFFMISHFFIIFFFLKKKKINKCIIEDLNVKKSNKIRQNCPECKENLSDQEIKELNLAWEDAPFKINLKKLSEPSTINKDNVEKGNFYVVLLNG